ncbi:MAG: polysaccharide biosynthesis protein, partial [Butyrivibrio sp.]|nr:polysaccharide biosynthesis protein [Butyrivibrio sp.]
MSQKKNKEPFNYQKLYRRTGLIIYDIISIIAASYIAILIRYEFRIGNIPDHFIDPVNTFLLINIIITLVIFYFFKLYDSLWAYAGEREMQNLVMACVISGVINAVGLQFFKSESQPVPQSYYFLYTFLLITFIFISRFSYRFLRGQKHRAENKHNSKAVMIIGAGE